ncbi:hemerythrin domain-containing protein [Kocuria sp.]|jgi:hemerythrin-like domain-containing protein|uniref:hemerythrin domain-containing protein n=1 Tax=Kocuria sp. TaxID=1871328 RepID=UPI002811A73E|nr:hemerythrin domain-containing protein [Kocuria sp.]HST73004.1 hemerythrin domain-containing protein [Kocuria rosea]
MTETHAGGAGQDVVDILTTDHREMFELLGEITTAPDAARRRELADTVIAEVMRHAVAEEMYVYPAVKKHVPNGAEEVEHDKQEHDEIVQVMKRLEDVDASDPTFMGLVGELQAQLRHHIDDEESDQFPKLRAAVPADELVDMGQKVQAAKKLAPTRPHPHAPHSELFHKTVGPGVGMIDRLRDKLTGRRTG